MLQLERLAQAGFVLRGAGAAIGVDLFVSPRTDRLVPPVEPGSIRGLDAILATHEHRDHLDLPALPALADASPGASVVVPAPLRERVRSVVGERVLGADDGLELAIGGARIIPVPALHGVAVADAYTFGREISEGRCRYLGYVVDIAGVRVYHAGDTLAYDGLAPRLRALEVDVALLPINGRSAEREARGVVGNMDPVEAADLAAAAGVGALVPMHHDTIDGNTGSVAALRAHIADRGLPVTVFEMAPYSVLSWPPDRA